MKAYVPQTTCIDQNNFSTYVDKTGKEIKVHRGMATRLFKKLAYDTKRGFDKYGRRPKKEEPNG